MRTAGNVDIKRRVNACLNKLTRENFDASSTIVDMDFGLYASCHEVVALVYDKAVTQSYLGDVYADIANHCKVEVQSRFAHFQTPGWYCWSSVDGIGKVQMHGQ